METNEGNHDQDTEMTTIKPLPLTYERGQRLLFAAYKSKATMPSTSAQPLDKGKQKVNEEEEYHEVEREFEIIQIDSDLMRRMKQGSQNFSSRTKIPSLKTFKKIRIGLRV